MISVQKYKLEQIPKQLAEKETRLIAAAVLTPEQIQTELEKTRQKLIADAQLQTPALSANDRSRWDTIRVLVEPEMQAPGGNLYAIDKAQNEKNWDTIDMVKHDGHLYSSKPPLLPTILAIPYSLIYHPSGQQWTLGKTPFLVVRLMLVLCNLIPIIIGWILLSRLVEQYGTTDWGRIFTMAFICFGTFVSTFAVTLNNHLPAVLAVIVAFYLVQKKEPVETQRAATGILAVIDSFLPPMTNTNRNFSAGMCAAFAVACELPALLFCVLLPVCWIREDNRTVSAWAKKLLPYFGGCLCIAVMFFATNYAAHRTILPAYSQPGWYFYEYERGGVVRQSYWHNPSKIDQGEPSRAAYLWHCTFGHHGLFSLTPVWLLSFIGLGMWLRNKDLRLIAAMILFTSIVVFVFYMMQAQPNRNYGGMTSCLRWMLWFVPLWSVPLVTAADWLSKTALWRGIAYSCLAMSVMSVSYPVWNPWTHPWLYNLLAG
ncbi:hypothetical protein FACS1894170_09240 [Planctomycetales bacterium]|nr:hypothetical protein FACS1894170_09240 [Planctomycetales bacterium]